MNLTNLNETALEEAARLSRALELIASVDNRDLVQWAKENDALDPRVLDILARGYQPTYRKGFEYRGALVAVYREIAKQALGMDREG